MGSLFLSAIHRQNDNLKESCLCHVIVLVKRTCILFLIVPQAEAHVKFPSGLRVHIGLSSVWGEYLMGTYRILGILCDGSQALSFRMFHLPESQNWDTNMLPGLSPSFLKFAKGPMPSQLSHQKLLVPEWSLHKMFGSASFLLIIIFFHVWDYHEIHFLDIGCDLLLYLALKKLLHNSERPPLCELHGPANIIYGSKVSTSFLKWVGHFLPCSLMIFVSIFVHALETISKQSLNLLHNSFRRWHCW